MAEQPTFPVPIETPGRGPPPPSPRGHKSYKSRRHHKTGGKKRSSSSRRGQSRTKVTSDRGANRSRRGLETAAPTSEVSVLVPTPTVSGTTSLASVTPSKASTPTTSSTPLPELQAGFGGLLGPAVSDDLVVKLHSEQAVVAIAPGPANEPDLSPRSTRAGLQSPVARSGQVGKIAPSAGTPTAPINLPLHIDQALQKMRGNFAHPSGGQGHRPFGGAQGQPSEKRGSQRIRPRHLLLPFVGALVLTAVLYWFVAGSQSELPTGPNACATLGCLEYAKRLHATVNRSANPCQSFTRFVCSGWNQNNPWSVREDYFRQALGRLNRTLHKVTWPSRGQNEEQRAAAIYHSCDDVLQGKTNQLPEVKAALAEAGIVWPQLSPSADVLYTIMFCSFKLGLDVLLDFEVDASAGGKPALLMQFGKWIPTLLSLHKLPRTNATKEAYFQFLRKAFEEGSNVTYPESVTYQYTSINDEYAINKLEHLVFETSPVESVEDITTTLTHINLTESRWLETLEKLHVSARSPFPLTTQLGYVKAVFGVWEAFGEDSFHVFVSWWTVQIAALYANRDLILNVYYPYPEYADVYHVAFCVGRAAYFSSHAVFARHSREIVKGGVGSVARKLVLTMRRAFLRRLLRWNCTEVDVTLITNWTSLSVAFRSFDYLNGTEIVDSGPIPDMTRSFIDNWKHSVLVKRTLDSEYLLAAIDNLLAQFFLVNEHDTQLLPYALSYPLFDLDLPAAVNYGGFGADVGNGLANLLLRGLASANSTLRKSFLECMSQTLFSNATWMAYIYQAVMFGALIDAYKESDFGVYLPLPGFEGYNGLQTLFLSQCYTWCGGSDDEAAEFTCDIYLQQVPEFAEAFNCSKGDPMYPEHQCKLF